MDEHADYSLPHTPEQAPSQEVISIDSSPEPENDKTPVSRREKKIWMHYRAMEIEIQAINQAIAKIKADLSDVTKAVKNLSHTFEVVKQVFGEMADMAKNLETENMEPEMEPEMETEV